jgi:integrase
VPEATFGLRLQRWQLAQGIGKKERTQRFHAEIAAIIRANLPDLDALPSCLDEETLAMLATKVTHYCPSRWNCIVSAVRYVTQNAKALKYRKLRFRTFHPPTAEDFKKLLAECDRAPKSLCGLTVRLLSLTGLRISEARQLRWEHVKTDHISLPGSITKNGLPRSVPFLPGARGVLTALRCHAVNGYVLPIPSMRTALKKACDRAGVPRMSNHDFRHLFATKAIEAGVDLATISRRLGHQCGGALLSKMYFHLASHHSRAMAERVRVFCAAIWAVLSI